MAADISAPTPTEGDAPQTTAATNLAERSARAFSVVTGLLLVLGGFLIVNGGRGHPKISQDMGTFGSPDFYRHFAQMMVTDHAWYSVHSQIMWGPIAAAIGAYGIVALVRGRGDTRWAPLGANILVAGTVLWTLVYCFDGFISPKLAPLLLNADPALEPSINATFGASQLVAITVGLPGWILMSVGQLLLGVAALATRSAGTDRKLTTTVGALGVLLGVSSLAAWAAGSFNPGPMISPWWLINAYLGAIWFVVAGVWVILRRRESADPAPVRA